LININFHRGNPRRDIDEGCVLIRSMFVDKKLAGVAARRLTLPRLSLW
jgi:hypothetical protein